MTLREQALALLLVCGLAGSAVAQEGHVIYVSVDKVEDPGLKKQLAEFGGKQAHRLEIAMGSAEQYPDAKFHLTAEASETGSDAGLCDAMGAADLIVLRGGSFMQWFDRVYPNGPKTHLAAAFQDVFKRRKPLIAYGGACAFLSGGVLVDSKDLRKATQNPRWVYPWEARVAVGIGPSCLFEWEEGTGGSPLRLVKAMKATEVDRGVLFQGEVALDFDRVKDRLEVMGPGSVLFFSLERARANKNRLQGGRLSHLFAGDPVWLSAKRVELATGKIVVRGQGQRSPMTGRGFGQAGTYRGFGGPGDLAGQGLARWIRNGYYATRRYETGTWTIGWDERSRRQATEREAKALGAAPTEPTPRLTRIDLIFDCDWSGR